jgi:hypothetical protein
MDDRDDLDSIAAQLITWEVAAQQIPLTDLTALLADCQNDLAHSLNTFHDLYDHHPDHMPADAFWAAVGVIIRQATTAAILALGISQRARLTARQN